MQLEHDSRDCAFLELTHLGTEVVFQLLCSAFYSYISYALSVIDSWLLDYFAFYFVVWCACLPGVFWAH